MRAENYQLPYHLIDRKYIPIKSLGQKVETNLPYHLLETTRRMYNLSVFSFDIDGFITCVSPSPCNSDGTLDIGRLNALSPHTYPILERLAILSTHVPCIPNTGKSYVVKKTLYAEISRLRQRYMDSVGMGVITYESDGTSQFIANPAYIEPNTGRMRARDIDGNPSRKWLQFGISVYDNGGYVEDIYGPEKYEHREQFSDDYFTLFTNPEFQELILKTTRKDKIQQQMEIMKHHVLLSDYAINASYPNNSIYTATGYEAKYIRSGLIAQKASYTSPGAKNNFDLDLELLANDRDLQSEWDGFFYRHTYTDTLVRSFADLQTNLDIYFSGAANVSSNFVPGNPETGIGDRVAIDLTPLKVTKEWGLHIALEYIQSEQARAGIANSHFADDMIAGGDGAHRDKNDFDFIYDKRGITNTPNRGYTKVKGFPTHILDILPLFGVEAIEPLEQIEQTLVLIQLILHARLGLPKDDLPERTLRKLRFS